MNLQKGSNSMHQSLKTKEKPNNSTNLLVFLNDLKQTYKVGYSGSNDIFLDSFFNILTHVITITRKLSVPALKNNMTEKQICNSKSSLQKEIDAFLKSPQTIQLMPQAKNKEGKVSFLFSNENQRKYFDGPKTQREISNQNIIAKIKEKIKIQTLNISTTEVKDFNTVKNLIGIRSMSQTHRNYQRSPWKTIGNTTSRNDSLYSSNNISTMGKENSKQKENRERHRRENSEEFNNGFKGKDRTDFGSKYKNQNKGESSEKPSPELKLSFYATHLVSQYHNVIDKFYTIKTEEEDRRLRTYSEGRKKVPN